MPPLKFRKSDLTEQVAFRCMGIRGQEIGTRALKLYVIGAFNTGFDSVNLHRPTLGIPPERFAAKFLRAWSVR